ncbi:Crp/Fnr family transcriptional regulator [Acuticoccus sp. MNP-M23]|uniref:Crp/Fnr family transcriptional regulator n=1 Tax=Acuticoccus sp. MNP-M23 TaxID=3072793 RepID=UPI0028153F4A|nr:Crp/Fnr family transcriptional regulator [Acuticoccus sp. MNP-M23]WMS40835.1 Crp/Fnr family transcriptional regulator [Acuticoccus sp. MNP-M23]
MTESCLFSKLSKFVELSEADRRLLAVLETDERSYEKEQLVRRTGDPVTEMFVVKSGWLVSYSILADGRRQLLRLFYPGDIVDLSEIALERAQHDIKCVTAATLCPFPKAGLEPLMVRSPRLTALLFSMTVKESAVLLDRIRAIGRLSAYERLCYLLLEIADRLSLTVPDVGDGFRLPLTQGELADFLGLTNVYVSKTISRIERDRLVRRQGNRIILLDPDRMREICEYNFSHQIDTSWFPGN